jgi:hypothetical protein
MDDSSEVFNKLNSNILCGFYSKAVIHDKNAGTGLALTFNKEQPGQRG